MRLDQHQARARFGAARVARLATADAQGRPHLVPVTFALRGDVVVTAVDDKPKRTTELRRLRNIEANSRVCVLVDHYDEDWSQLWWVRVDGDARVLRGDDRTEPVRWLAHKYARYQDLPPAGPVIWIGISAWRGWAYSTGPPR